MSFLDNNMVKYHLVDTHCHVHDRSLYRDVLSRQKKEIAQDFVPSELLKNAGGAGLTKLITIGTNHDDSESARNFAATYTENVVRVYWSYGIHPEYAEQAHPSVSDLARKLISEEASRLEQEAALNEGMPKVEAQHDGRLVAIGEVGLDYHYPGYSRDAQIRLLEEMLELARKLDLPLIFHVREAFSDFLAVLRNYSGGTLRGVVHSFSDSQENLEKCLGLNFYIGVNGLATFADIPLPPLERTVLETDAPFLTPAPYRGRVNQPSYVAEVARFLSGRWQVGVDEVADVTTANAERLFGF